MGGGDGGEELGDRRGSREHYGVAHHGEDPFANMGRGEGECGGGLGGRGGGNVDDVAQDLGGYLGEGDDVPLRVALDSA